MLNKIINEELLEARGTIAFFSANSVGDDIYLFSDDHFPRGQPLAVLHGLRQQVSVLPIKQRIWFQIHISFLHVSFTFF